MSRTYRKPKWILEESKENFIKRNISYERWHYEYIMTDENKKKFERDLEIYEEKRKRYYSGFPVQGGFWSLRKPEYRQYMIAKAVHDDVDIDAEIEDNIKRYAKFSRDGWWNESGRNTLYKEWSKKTVRTANKRLERKILKDDEYDHLSYPDYYLAKHLAWSIW